MKVGDKPIITRYLYNMDGDIIDLTDSSVNFYMVKDVEDATIITIPCDVSENKVTYQLINTDESGMYRMGFIIEYTSGEIKTIPERGYEWIFIEEVTYG